MSYYQGDFYQGDPGFFSGLGRIVKGLAGSALGFVPGGGTLSRAARAVGGAIVKHPTISAAGAAGGIGMGTGLVTGRMSGRATRMLPPEGFMPGAGMRGRTGGGRAFGLKHRRMRVTNLKALRRAIRRAKGFEKLARKVMHFTSPRKVHGRAIFRVRKRKAV